MLCLDGVILKYSAKPSISVGPLMQDMMLVIDVSFFLVVFWVLASPLMLGHIVCILFFFKKNNNNNNNLQLSFSPSTE